MSAIQLKTRSNHLVSDYKPTVFSQRPDQTGVLSGLPMLHRGSLWLVIVIITYIFVQARIKNTKIYVLKNLFSLCLQEIEMA